MLPIASSLQPFFILLLAPYSLLKILNEGKFKTEFLVVLLFFMYCLIMLLPGQLALDLSSIKKLFAIPASLVIIALKDEIMVWLSIRRIKIISSIYALISAFQFIFGQTAGNITALFLHRNGTDYQFRGVNSLTTEPSFAGHIACAFFILYLIRKSNDNLHDFDKLILFNITVIATLSKSATGIASFFIVFFGAQVVKLIIKLSLKRMFTLLVIMGLCIFFGSFIPRVVGLIELIYNYGIFAVLNDPSTAARFLQPYFGLQSLLSHPLGHGIGRSAEVYLIKLTELSRQFEFSDYAYRRLLFEMNSPVSVLGQYMVDVGAITLVLLFFLILNIRGEYKIERLLFISLSLLQSHSFMYPFIWLISGNTKK